MYSNDNFLLIFTHMGLPFAVSSILIGFNVALVTGIWGLITLLVKQAIFFESSYFDKLIKIWQVSDVKLPHKNFQCFDSSI